MSIHRDHARYHSPPSASRSFTQTTSGRGRLGLAGVQRQRILSCFQSHFTHGLGSLGSIASATRVRVKVPPMGKLHTLGGAKNAVQHSPQQIQLPPCQGASTHPIQGEWAGILFLPCRCLAVKTPKILTLVWKEAREIEITTGILDCGRHIEKTCIRVMINNA